MAWLFVLGTIALASVPSRASAQLSSSRASVSLNATLNSSITVTAAPGLVNFNLVRSGIANGNTAVSINTAWTLPVLFGNVTEYAYFASPASALSDGVGDLTAHLLHLTHIYGWSRLFLPAGGEDCTGAYRIVYGG